MPNTDTSPLVASTAANPKKTLLAIPSLIGHHPTRGEGRPRGASRGVECVLPGRSGIRRAMRSSVLMLAAAGALAACGSAAVPGRAQVPGFDRVRGEVASLEVDLGAADLASVRGPSGWVLVG